MTSDLDPTPNDLAAAGFAFEMGVLKRIRRAGWWHVGVRDPESVAEHSLRVAQLAGLLAANEGGDPARAAYLGIWHDSQETRTGDIPHTGKKYMQMDAPEKLTADQTADLSGPIAETVQGAVAEYEARETIEAICASDADKLECLIQALEYRAAGYQNVQEWIDTSRRALRTPSAQRIADAALAISPLKWRE